MLASQRKIIISSKVLAFYFMAFFLISLSFISAHRFLGLDKDYFSYFNFYDTLSDTYDGRFEVGFVAFAHVSKSLGLSFWWLLFFSAFVALSAKIYLIKRLPHSIFWFFIYFTTLFYLHELTQIRVGIALGFGYVSLYYRYQTVKKKLSLFFLVMSVLFHWTLLFFVPFWMFPKLFSRKDKFFIFLVIFAPSLFIFFSVELFQYLNPQVGKIVANAESDAANPLSSRNLVSAGLLLVGLLNLKKLPASSVPFFYLSLAGLSVWYGLMSIPVFAHRIYELTIMSYYFWISFLPRDYKLLSMTLLAILSGWVFIRIIYFGALFA